MFDSDALFFDPPSALAQAASIAKPTKPGAATAETTSSIASPLTTPPEPSSLPARSTPTATSQVASALSTHPIGQSAETSRVSSNTIEADSFPKPSSTIRDSADAEAKGTAHTPSPSGPSYTSVRTILVPFDATSTARSDSTDDPSDVASIATIAESGDANSDASRARWSSSLSSSNVLDPASHTASVLGHHGSGETIVSSGGPPDAKMSDLDTGVGGNAPSHSGISVRMMSKDGDAAANTDADAKNASSQTDKPPKAATVTDTAPVALLDPASQTSSANVAAIIASVLGATQAADGVTSYLVDPVHGSTSSSHILTPPSAIAEDSQDPAVRVSPASTLVPGAATLSIGASIGGPGTSEVVRATRFSLAGTTIPAGDFSAFHLAPSMALEPGGPALTLSSQTISLAPHGSYIVVDGSKQTPYV
ncbi:hypothetical protein B0A50_06846 [Salinomyces thailandicus]|uniref:Uncharacterized protein n=1 Tax=Salinomyces thailandicus TaxID=706561 RepID=A0A4U0TQE1_9PEZI|nr:hypothetical protein B0A50_06846 [Salinomyces thailandica]